MAHRTPEFSHRLLPNDDRETERRINLEAIEVKLMRDRVERLEAELGPEDRKTQRARRRYENRRDCFGELCMGFFKVVGADLYDGTGEQYGYDESLLFAIAVALKKLDPKQGLFVNLVRRITKTDRIDSAKKEDSYQSKVEAISDEDRGIVSDAVFNGGWGNLLPSSSNEGWDNLAQEDERDGWDDEIDDEEEFDIYAARSNNNDAFLSDANDAETIIVMDGDDAGEEDAVIEQMYVEVLSLIVGILDHKEDGRDHTPKKKLYTRLFFTESVTRAVKECPTESECVPFEKHEYETIQSVELPFQDTYTVSACRRICELWKTPLKEGYGEVLPYGHPKRMTSRPWHLNADAFRAYVEYIIGESVSRAAVSNQRANYNALLGELRREKVE